MKRLQWMVAMAALVALFPGGALAAPAPARALASTTLVPFPPAAAPFHAAGRKELALDALTYFVQQQGLFPGRSVFQLPAAPWFGGNDVRAPQRAWDVTVPPGIPLYLLAHADEDGHLETLPVVTLDGTPLAGLEAYVYGGVAAPAAGRIRDYAVLDLVLAPPPPGRHLIEVRGSDTTLRYDLTVQAPDALSPVLVRDGAGTTYALEGPERRRVPDEASLRALGYGPAAVTTLAPAALAALPEGAPLPALRDGMLVRADNHRAVFRLQGGKRVWLPEGAGGEEPVTLAASVVRAIPPQLAENMLMKGSLADTYHVDRLSLRKVPDWKWVEKQGLSAADLLYVPDWVIAQLPQGSPHWVMPGGVWTDRTFYSEALGRTMPYRLYLPPGYARGDRRYPVVYLLHGMSGRYDEWSGYGVEEVANGLLPEGKFVHAIMVAPQGGLGYWVNQAGGVRWSDYVASDLVQHVDTTYRTIASREARAVGGLSMGGHGALQLALNHPNVFGVAGAHSPSIRPKETAPAFFGSDAGYARRDPLTLVKDSRLARPPRIWIDAGQNDSWRPGAEALHRALVQKGWAHEWHVFGGEHDGWYWGDHLWEYLPFYAAAFADLGVPVVR